MSQRPERYQSHALVELKKSRFLPWGRRSGVLLDLSEVGFKLELTEPMAVRLGDGLSLTVPLRPLGVIGPPAVTLRCQVKWIDQGRGRIGGIFVRVTTLQRALVGQVVENLRQRGLIT